MARPFALLPIFVMACTGQIDTGPASLDPMPTKARPSAPPAKAIGPEAVPAVSPAPMIPRPIETAPPVPGAACASTGLTGPVAMRRLTNAEYGNTIRQLFGSASAAMGAVVLPTETVDDGFENGAAAQIVSNQHVSAYLEVAEGVTRALAADPKQRAAFYGCTPSAATRTACTDSFITRFGRRSFRHPLTKAETDTFRTLARRYDTDVDLFAGLDAVAQAMLISPSFLFLAETGTLDDSQPGRARLSGYELAARLGFWLLGTTPDDLLLDEAAAGTLDTTAGLTQVVRRLTTDTRAGAGRWAFFSRWLRLPDLATVMPDKTKYPAWTPTLRDAYAEETRRFFEEMTRGQGLSLLDVVTAGTTTINDVIAPVYALKKPPAGTWLAQDLTPQGRGAGVLTQGSFLALSAIDEAGTPIRRGAFIRQALMCQALPPPPADVPSIDGVKVPNNAGIRERLTAHRADPACAGCHKLLDPVGFGLLGFDGIGQARNKDAWGNPIDTRGQVAGAAQEDFAGPAELGARLRATGDIARCLVTEASRWALGRALVEKERCALAAVDAAFARDGKWQTLVEGFVTSDLFRYRLTAGGAP